MFHSLDSAIRELFGPEIQITNKTRVFGGDINDAFRLTLADGSGVFMKTNSARMLPSFEAEEAGLLAIAGTGRIGTAKVLGIGTDPEGFSFLLQELITPGQKIRSYWETLGAELCAMHRAPVLPKDRKESRPGEDNAPAGNTPTGNTPAGNTPAESVPAGNAPTGNTPAGNTPAGKAPAGKDSKSKYKDTLETGQKFGFPADNFIGAGKQINTWHTSWIGFYRDCRLLPQLRQAERYLDKKDRACASALLEHLDKYLVEPAAPSLLHGDLWGGNVMTGPDGKAWIIDPAVYYGHPEADLAMTELFGGFAPAFYSTYFECADLTPGYRDRRDLYNLYHLLNHLNLFGSGYLSQVRQILCRYHD